MTPSDSDRNPMGELAAEWRERLRRGERPQVAEYVARHPDLADEIRELLPAVVMMEELKPAAGDLTGAFSMIGGGGTGVSPVRTGETPVPHAPAAGPRLNRLGDYLLLREVGRGGMGVVYEAEQESLGRRVALKVLPGQALSDPQHQKRFLREARAAARLHHTNIVPVYGVGEHEGTLYYVMQFIQGQGLDAVLGELKRLRSTRTLSAAGAPTPATIDSSPVPRDISAVDVARSLLRQSPSAAGPRPSAAGQSEESNSLGPKAVGPAMPDAHQSGTAGPTAGATVEGRSPTAEGRQPIAEGRHYWESVARIGIQVAEALDYAAGQSILHRDIKPSNLLLDTNGTVWVTDFGLAKVTVEADNLTHTGEIVGTLRYMPPERFEGKSDIRGDIYALGLTLYEMLTLRPAYEESNRHNLIEQVVNRDPPPPRKLNPHIPRDLETIILKATARDPAHRYQTAADFAADLKRFAEDRPIRARRFSLRERFWRWCRRNPALAASTGLSAVALLAVTVLSVAFAFVQSNSSAELARAFSKLSDEKDRTAQALEHSQELARNLATEKKKTEDEQQRTQNALDDSQKLAKKLKTEQEKTRDALDRSLKLAKNLETEQEKTQRALTESKLVSARMQLERGQSLVQQQAPQFGALWMARALETAPARAEDLRQVARANLDGLRRELPVLRAVLIDKELGVFLDISPDGRLVVTSGTKKTARLWRVPRPTEGHEADGGAKKIADLTHEGRVDAVAFSPDGKLVATGGLDRMARLWDTSGKPVGEPLLHPGSVVDLHFSPDSKLLLTSCSDRKARVWNLTTRKLGGEPLTSDTLSHGTFSPDGKIIMTGFPGRAVRLWDAATGRPLGEPLLHPNTVFRAVFSPDSRRVFTGCFDRKARLWDVATGKQVGEPMEHAERIGPLAFRPDGKLVVTGTAGGTARLWDAATGKAVGQPMQHSAAVMSVAFSPDSRTVLTAGGDYSVRLWDADTGRPLGQPLVHPTLLTSAHFSPDGRTLFVLGRDQCIRLWELPEGRLAQAPLTHRDPVWALAFSPDGKTIVTGDGDFDHRRGEARLWDVVTGKPIGGPLVHTNKIERVVFSPDGKTVLTASVDRSARLWDAATGKPIGEPILHTASIWRAAFSPDGKRVALGGSDGTARVWDLDSRLPIGLPLRHDGPIVAVSFSPDGKLVATGSRDNTARLWNAVTGKPVGDPLRHQGTGWVQSVEFSHDGKLLLTGGSDRTARLWNVSTGKLAGPPLQHQATVLFAVFSPDGKTILTAGDRLVRLWDPSGRPVGPPLQHPEVIGAVAFSPDSQSVLTGCRDGTVRLWHARTGQPLAPPFLHSGFIHAVAFSPDGRTVLTGSEDRTARLWTVPLPVPGEPARLARWVEVNGGQGLTSEDMVHLFDGPTWEERRQQLEKLGGPPDSGAAEPDSAWHQRLAAEAAATGHWFAARWHLDRVVSLRPDDWFARAQRATVHFRLGDTGRAAEDCARALKLGPPDTVRDWFGQQSPDLSPDTTWEAALWYLEQVIKGLPKDGPARVLRARANQQLGKPDLAQDDLTQALALGPRKEVLARFRAICDECEIREDWKTAVWFLDRLARADPTEWFWHSERGKAHARLGEFEQAAEAYARAIVGDARLRPLEVWGAHLALRLHTGDVEGYRKGCNELLNVLKSDTPFILNNIAWWCILAPDAVTDPQRFITLAEKATKPPPTSRPPTTTQPIAPVSGAQNTLGAALYRAGRLNEALDHLNRSAKTFGAEGKVTDWVFLAMVHHRLGNSGEARRWLGKVEQWLDGATPEKPKDAALGIPVSWPLWLQVHLLHQEAAALIKGTPEKLDTDLRLAYAHAHVRLGQWDRAAADFSKVIELRPKDFGLRVERGLCYLRSEQWEKAVADLDVGVEQRPADAVLWAARGRARLRLNKAVEAVNDLGRAVELQLANFEKTPTQLAVREALGEAYRELAEAQRAQGRPVDAAATLRRLRDLWPGHAARLHGVARQMALCVTPPPKGEAIPKERAAIADQAMATLAEAVRVGFQDFVALRDEADLAPLRSRDDFKALLSEVGRSSDFPAPTGELYRLVGHDAAHGVMAVAVSPDGRRVLTGGYDKTARLWDLVSGKELHRLDFTEAVFGVAFSFDGRRALVASGEPDLRLWNLETGKEIRRLVGHVGWVGPVCFLPGDRQALSAGSDYVLRLWDLEAGKELLRLKGHTSSVLRLAVSPDGKRALSGGYDKVLRLWDLKAGKELRHFDGHQGTIYGVAFLPDGLHGLSASDDGFVRLWDLDSGREVRRFEGHWGAIRSIAVSPEGHRALTAGSDGKLILWDVDSGKELHRFERANQYYITFFPNTPRALGGGGSGRACLWDVADETVRARDHARLGQSEQAEKAYAAALKRRPADALLLIERAQFYARMGKWEQAVADLDSALGLKLSGKTVLAAVADLYRRRVEQLVYQGEHKEAEKLRTRTRELYEKLLAAQPEPSIAGELAGLLRPEKPWTVLKPIEATSALGVTLTRQADDSVLASGKAPDNDTYTIVADTDLKGITALRIEALPDPSFPQGGSGRAGSGNFVMTNLQVTAAPKAGPGKAEDVKFLQAEATFSQDSWDVRDVLDNDSATGWAIHPNVDRRQAGYFALKPISGFSGGTRLTIRLDFRSPQWKDHVLGRFRLSITTDPAALKGRGFLGRPGLNGWTKLAAMHYQREDWPATLAALAKAPAGGYEHFLSALVQMRTGHPEDARKSLDQGLAWMDKNNVSEALESFAVEALTAVLAKTPDEVALLTRRARLLAHLGRRDEAAADYRKAAGREPKDPRWPARLAQLSTEVIAFWNFDLNAAGWQGNANCRLTSASGHLLVENSGLAPHLSTKLTAAAGWYELTLRVRVKEAMVARVVWGKPSATGPSWTGARSQWFVLPDPPKGAEGKQAERWSECRVVFRADEAIDGLRLEFGDKDSSLEIESLTLRKHAKGSENELLRQTTQAVEQAPGNWRIHMSCADVYLRLGQKEQAAAEFATAARKLTLGGTGVAHREFIRMHEGAQNLPLAIAHLDMLIEAEKGKPDAAELLFWRGQLLGRMTRWKDALADHLRGIEIDPSDHWHWYCSASLRLYTGDRDGYRRDCEEMLRRFGETSNPTIAERVAKVCSLAPGAVDDPKTLQRLAARATSGTEKHEFDYWFLLARGMAEYRAGDARAALEWIEKSRARIPPTDLGNYSRVMSDLVAALCHVRTEPPQKEKARQALETATKALERQYPKEKAADLADWINWIQCDTIRREADRALHPCGKDEG